MKKRIGSLLLAVAMLVSSVSATFTDITKPAVRQAAEVLQSLGIVQGSGTGRFQPSAVLTRAQFCKLAVTAMGITDVSAYRSYSIFSDLPSSHWASGYVGALMKDSTLKSLQIIRGQSDGTFAPDKAITYGAACTMLLRMLGYTVSDIGAFWPQDDISKAQSLGLTKGVTGYSADMPLTRGDAAVLLLNTLRATPKTGDKLLYKSVSSTTVTDSILLATPQTDSSVSAGQARFYEDDAVVLRKMVSVPDSSLVGMRGTVLLDKDTASQVVGFLPDSDSTAQLTVRSTTSTSIESTSGQKYTIDSDTKVVVGGEVLSYSACYFDLVNSSICIYYDSSMQIELISKENTSTDATFVYGTANAANIPSSFSILKNGTQVGAADLKRYDLVSLDTASSTAYVSDQRVTGYLTAASPLYSAPSTVTVCGKSFTVSEKGAAYFAKMGYGDKVTMLLDRYGTVCAAYPAAQVSAQMIGQFTGYSSSTATVRLLSGVQISGTLGDSDMQLLLGQLVQVSVQQDGKLTLAEYPLRDNAGAAWSIADARVGTAKVSASVRVFESVDKDSGVSEIDVEDVQSSSVPEKYIRSVVRDTSGSVTAIILNDYTGDGWQYGICNVAVDSVSSTYSLKTYVDGAAATQSIVAVKTDDGNPNGKVIGLPKGMASIEGTLDMLPVKELQVVQQVGLSAFDGETGVRTTTGYYRLADDVGVYVARYGKMIALQTAKAECTQFTLYVDTETPQGGKVRVIIGK